MISGDVVVLLALAANLMAIAVIDMREMRIPDALNLTLLAGGVLACAVLGRHSLAWGLFSGATSAAGLWLVRYGYHLYRQRTGLGLGDVKFMGAAAVWVGLEAVPYLIMIASLTALLWLGGKALFNRGGLDLAKPIPFGPFLCAGLFAVWSAAPHMPGA